MCRDMIIDQYFNDPFDYDLHRGSELLCVNK